ncbi:sulfatase family protein [Reichenbachiella versicolor]|uniref:sulfatase family protein n=1 Tax=Reichenbachiella versicolor TaxID=1821036 RepID=UPI001C88B7BC|nr:sulfatase [Reichenbachiella versicolor]
MMNRNTLNLFSILSLILLTQFVQPLEAKQDRPNIVWVVSEDNSANWYRLYNPENGAAMPNIEKLAEHGLVFNDAYSCAPVCSAARSTIISGCYGPRLGSHFHRNQGPVTMPKGLKMFPAYLREAGYYTSNCHKEDYNFNKDEKIGVWDESSKRASYRKRAEGQPFFHVQNYHRTHESQMFKGLPEGRTPVVKKSEVQLFPYHPDTELFREKYAQYVTLNTIVDEEIGRLIKQLEDDGLMDDTFIFHYGDHGGVLPGGKGYAHNDGLQVAMVVYVPENWKHLAPAAAGSRVDGMVEFVDLSATVLNLAGVDVPEQMDGKPFLGKGVTTESLKKDDVAFGYADRFDEKYDLVRFLRKGKYTYWRSYQPFNYDGLFNEYRYKQPAFREWRDMAWSGKLNEVQGAFYEPRQPEQLYDLESDPHETNNLANDPKFASVLKEMRKEVQKRVKCMNDLSFIPESEFLKNSSGDGEAYGNENSSRISDLVDIADWQLLSFKKVKGKLKSALEMDDPYKRYWALINCSAFGKEAAIFLPKAKELAKNDPSLLVRTRAVEFIGLVEGTEGLAPQVMDILSKSTDPVEVNLILNTVVLLMDGAGLELQKAEIEKSQWSKMEGKVVPRRVEYLLSKAK